MLSSACNAIEKNMANELGNFYMYNKIYFSTEFQIKSLPS